MAVVKSPSDLLAAYDRHQPFSHLCSTGITMLDNGGGFRAGSIWLLVSDAGRGRTTLLTQWAVHLACVQGWNTWLMSPREQAATIASGMIANLSGVPRARIRAHQLREQDASPVEEARVKLLQSPLRVLDRSEPSELPVTHILAGHGHRAVLVDDADAITSCSPAAVAGLADAGVLVVVSLPRSSILGHVHQASDATEWRRVADVLLEVRTLGGDHADVAAMGRAELKVHESRIFPLLSTIVEFDPMFGRFLDRSLPPS